MTVKGHCPFIVNIDLQNPGTRFAHRLHTMAEQVRGNTLALGLGCYGNMIHTPGCAGAIKGRDLDHTQHFAVTLGHLSIKEVLKAVGKQTQQFEHPVPAPNSPQLSVKINRAITVLGRKSFTQDRFNRGQITVLGRTELNLRHGNL